MNIAASGEVVADARVKIRNIIRISKHKPTPKNKSNPNTKFQFRDTRQLKLQV